MKNLSKLPEHGMDKDKLFDYMEEQKVNDTSWRDGKTFCLVYDGGPEISEVIKTAYTMFMSENGLNPSAFPSLRKFENDIVSMCAHHLNGDKNVSGSMTSGGTESILLANKTAREWAKKNRPEITKPQIVMPITAHPAFNKAAYYFGLEVITTPVSDDYRADIKAMKNAITDQTIMLVGSAPNYPFGVIDPIEEIAKMAQEKNILCHVDCCIGGILLPLFKKLGKELPNFDFTVPGVTSISVDLHKYAYAAKGASVVLYKNKDLRQHQFFATTNWPGGMYGSPTMTGTRPGGAIAAAWAIMNYLGETGYLKLAKTIKDTTEEFTKRIKSTPGIEVATAPDMS
ncbi:MAG: aspartate aminotransferase family protein, partial [Bdellovibrionales bacterium]|nr:aspartate aminotransferase family protein [Bdellovibrionales bacterium]